MLPIGASEHGEIPLKEIPGCSRSFLTFESYLLETGVARPHWRGDLRAILIPISQLLRSAQTFFFQNPEELLCTKGTCKACDSRRQIFLRGNQTLEGV